MQGASARRVIYDPEPVLRILDRHRVEFVVIGGIAGVLQGSVSITHDLDVCYSRERANLERLTHALKELESTLRGVREPVRFRLDAATLAAGLNFTFDTKHGPFDCLGEASGGFGYQQLKRNADEMDIFGFKVLVASLDDLIRMKRAAGRIKDRIEVENLSALREVKESRRR